MRRTVTALVALLVLAAAADARASTATTADGNLRYAAAAGEVNNVTFARVSGDTFRVTELGATITAGQGGNRESPKGAPAPPPPGGRATPTPGGRKKTPPPPPPPRG